jgi:hypothetical protein
MLIALSFLPTKPHVLSITVAIVTGAAIYGCMMGAFYPDRTRSFWDKIKVFSRAGTINDLWRSPRAGSDGVGTNLE